MCNPVLIMSGVMAVASAVTTGVSISAQNDRAEAEVEAADAAAAADYVQQVEQQEQVNQSAAQERLQRAQAAMMERAKLRVSAGEAGIGGITPARELAETFMNEGLDASILETNRANRIRQIEVEKQATAATARGRRNVADAGKSSGWTAGLQIGSAAVQGGASGYGIGKSWGK